MWGSAWLGAAYLAFHLIDSAGYFGAIVSNASALVGPRSPQKSQPYIACREQASRPGFLRRESSQCTWAGSVPCRARQVFARLLSTLALSYGYSPDFGRFVAPTKKGVVARFGFSPVLKVAAELRPAGA